MTFRSTTGNPAASPRSICARTPFSTLGKKEFGTAPPTTFTSYSKPLPRGSGSTSMSHTAYCPCPPDCFTCRPWPLEELASVSRSGTTTGREARWSTFHAAGWRWRSQSQAPVT